MDWNCSGTISVSTNFYGQIRLIYLQKAVRPKKLHLFDNWTFISAVILHMNKWGDLVKVADVIKRFRWLHK